MIMAPTSQSAALVFTASTVLIGLGLILIFPTWRSIQKALIGLTHEQQRLAFSERNFEGERYRRRAWLLNFLYWGCGFLVASIFFNLFGLLGTTSTMLGLHLGPFVEHNFNGGILCVFIGTGTFFPGVFLIGLVHVGEALMVRLGRPSLLFIENTLGDEREQPVVQKDEDSSQP